MSMHRDDDTPGLTSNQVRVAHPVDYVFTSLSADWGPQYGGAFALGTRQDIKLLEDFCVEHGFALCESTVLYDDKVWDTLRSAFRVRPRGYLILPYRRSYSGVRMLRLTQVSDQSGPKYYIGSSQERAVIKLLPGWPLRPFTRVRSSRAEAKGSDL